MSDILEDLRKDADPVRLALLDGLAEIEVETRFLIAAGSGDAGEAVIAAIARLRRRLEVRG